MTFSVSLLLSLVVYFQMASLTEQERISLLMMRGWGDRQRSYNEVVDLFNATFRVGEAGISKGTVSKTIRRFEETGSNKSRPKPGRPKSQTNEEHQFEVALSFVENPRLSTRNGAQQLGMSQRSVVRNLKHVKFHPYKIHLHQELNEDDFDRRVQFCEIMMDRIDQDPNFLHLITFTDESTFKLNGEVNRHNFRYWSNENPHWLVEAHTQTPQKLNVWAGLIRDRIIGPFFIQGNLDGERYLDLLINDIVPAIQEITSDDFNEVWFQQDGAPPHYRNIVRDYLNVTFPNRWIGRRGTIEWPPRSPDLAPPDFFLWGYIKSEVYITQPRDLAELRQRIVDVCTQIPPEIVFSAIENFYIRLGRCQIVDGGHFEHLP